MDEDLKVEHRAVDHPRSVACPHWAATVALTETAPWVVIGGVTLQPGSLHSFRSPNCRRRAYLFPVTNDQKAADAEFDAPRDKDEDSAV
jgi:hypothetical protein